MNVDATVIVFLVICSFSYVGSFAFSQEDANLFKEEHLQVDDRQNAPKTSGRKGKPDNIPVRKHKTAKGDVSDATKVPPQTTHVTDSDPKLRLDTTKLPYSKALTESLCSEMENYINIWQKDELQPPGVDHQKLLHNKAQSKTTSRLIPLLTDKSCSGSLAPYVSLLYSIMCDNASGDKLLPCRYVCEKAHRDCQRSPGYGNVWPLGLPCDTWPKSGLCADAYPPVSPGESYDVTSDVRLHDVPPIYVTVA